MTKAKQAPRQALPVEAEDDLGLPEAWRRRPWIPYAVVIAFVAVILGSGLAMNRALQPAQPSALSNCITSTPDGPHTFLSRQPICIVPGKKYTATLHTTAGDFVIKLLPETAPMTVNNFVVLAVNGYYDGLSFWDAQGWEVQGGDPRGNGTGGPGYTLPEEPSPKLTWDPGSVGMARVPGAPINGSQFFITKAAWPGGPTQVYNRFGTVISGLDKVSAISAGDRINTINITVS